MGQDAIKAGVTDGRGGKGIVYVFAAGNEYEAGGNTNFEGYLHSRYVMTVGAVGMDLLHASYSSTGASVFVSAPGGDGGDVRGMVTVTGTSCGSAGSGTSFATPIVSGVAALMLEANPNLGWRDVQGIIATTSKMPDDDGDLPRSVNAAGIGHSYQYGFGIIDAAAAVAAARTWQNYYTETVFTAMASPGAAIADDGAFVSSTISGSAAEEFNIETVVVLLTINHPHRGDLRIILERDGVESLLAPESDEDGDGYADWKYTTVRHWGEAANGGGDWTLKVADVRARNGPGTFVSWTLQVHGHAFCVDSTSYRDPYYDETCAEWFGDPCDTGWFADELKANCPVACGICLGRTHWRICWSHRPQSKRARRGRRDAKTASCSVQHPPNAARATALPSR